MPETEELVINTGPLLALIAGVGNLSLLEQQFPLQNRLTC
jgi:hypothetical protein